MYHTFCCSLESTYIDIFNPQQNLLAIKTESMLRVASSVSNLDGKYEFKSKILLEETLSKLSLLWEQIWFWSYICS